MGGCGAIASGAGFMAAAETGGVGKHNKALVTGLTNGPAAAAGTEFRTGDALA